MKKIFSIASIIVLSCSLFAGATTVPSNINNIINTDAINYRYNFSLKKCEPFNCDLKAHVIKMLRTNNIVVENLYENSVGIAFEMSYENDGKVFEMILTNTYGECRLYEDIVLNSKDVKDHQLNNYSKMKYK